MVRLLNFRNVVVRIWKGIEIRQYCCSDVAELQSHEKVEFIASESSELPLSETHLECDHSDGCVENLHLTSCDDNRALQLKSPRNLMLQQDREMAQGRECGVSSHGEQWLFWVLLLLFMNCVEATPHRDLKCNIRIEVKVPLNESTGHIVQHFDEITQHYYTVCVDRSCDEAKKYRIDLNNNMYIVASEETSGNYSVVEFDTNEIVFTFQLILDYVSEAEKMQTEAKVGVSVAVGISSLIILAVAISLIFLCYRRLKKKRALGGTDVESGGLAESENTNTESDF